eukprot:1089863-Amphidinium_carterae.1
MTRKRRNKQQDETHCNEHPFSAETPLILGRRAAQALVCHSLLALTLSFPCARLRFHGNSQRLPPKQLTSCQPVAIHCWLTPLRLHAISSASSLKLPTSAIHR